MVFPVANDGGTEGTFSGVFELNDEQVEQLQRELFYIDLHTANFDGGEVRGQVHLP